MQFGRVLAFATLVLASPAPQMANLEDRAVAISVSGLTQSFNNAANIIKSIAVGNVVNIQAVATAGVGGTINTATTAIASINSTVTSSITAVLSDVSDTVKNATALAAYINATISGTVSTLFAGASSDGVLLIAAANNLVNALKSVSLAGVLVVSATLTSNAKQTLQAEITSVQNFVTPIVNVVLNALVTPLTQLQASVTASASSTLPTLASTFVFDLGTFVSQASVVVPTVSQ